MVTARYAEIASASSSIESPFMTETPPSIASSGNSVFYFPTIYDSLVDDEASSPVRYSSTENLCKSGDDPKKSAWKKTKSEIMHAFSRIRYRFFS